MKPIYWVIVVAGAALAYLLMGKRSPLVQASGSSGQIAVSPRPMAEATEEMLRAAAPATSVITGFVKKSAPAKKAKSLFGKVTSAAKKVVKNKAVKGLAVTAASVYGTPAAGAAVGAGMSRVR